MRPPFNSFQHQPRPQRQPHQQQQNNVRFPSHHQHNGYQNNPQMMNNPMMGHMNNQIPMPNMPIHPQFFNNLPNMPQQQQQLHQYAMSNHINQLLPSLLGNLHNLMGHSLPLVQPNLFRPPLQPSAFTSQPQLNSFNSLPYPPVPNSQQNHQLQPSPGFSEPRPQGQSVGMVDNTNGSASKGNDFRNNFTKHQKFKGPGQGQGYQRSQLHQADNVKRSFNKDHTGKGKHKKMANGHNGSDAGNIAKGNKKPLAWAYTPKEIQRWRDARRKHFPTNLNVEKRLKKNVSDGILDEEAKMRRQHIQEVLASQAQLGCPVAEVPSHYLSNTDEQLNGDGGDNNGQFQYKVVKKERFQNNRHNKRRHGDKEKVSKKPRFQDTNSSQESSVTRRKPTLLEKLLSADIKREKSQLLQALRFMVINSFLKESPEQPLKLPLITVEEIDYDDDYDVDANADDDLCDEAVD